jgi:hypothetical protein
VDASNQAHLYQRSSDNNPFYYRAGANLTAAAGTGRRHMIATNVGTAATLYRNGSSIASGAVNTGAMTFSRLCIGGLKNDSTETFFHKGLLAAAGIGSSLVDAAGLTTLLDALGVTHGV